MESSKNPVYDISNPFLFELEKLGYNYKILLQEGLIYLIIIKFFF